MGGSEEGTSKNPAQPRWIGRPEWLARFREEAIAHLAEISLGLEKLPPRLGQSESAEERQAQYWAVRELYRQAHTIKGSAGMVGLSEIAEQAGQLEELLGQAMKEPASFNSPQRELVRSRTEQLRADLTLKGN